MKKYLKKALSALIALAVAGSMIPASFAAKVELTDVAGTTYETAIKTLVSLGIIDGFAEDNTYRPDELITREQTAKVVVAALNQIDSAEAMAGKTEFSDVASDRWSSGYVNAGVQEGFINGMGDGTFAPTENVTFAQMVKMLVSVLGYDAHADYMGGWPNGYVSIAKTEGVTDGVKANNNDQVTRGQVAQLVYNALNTPIVKEGALKFDSKGEPYAELTIMNGEDGTNYKTLLTEKFDAYTVEGKITDTYRTGSVSEPGMIKINIEKTKAYDNEDVVVGAFGDEIIAADIDADKYVGTYGEIIIMLNEDDEYELLSFAPAGKNKTVELDASLLDKIAGGSVYFYPTESATKSTEYELEDAFVLYVNGVQVKAIADNEGTLEDETFTMTEQLNKFLNADTQGSVKLVDNYKTDGEYDAVYVSYYATVEVDGVNTKTGKVSFDSTNAINATSSSITLDDEDEELVYSITFNGEEISLAELKEDDILTIAYNVGNDGNASIGISKFYEIYVARDVQVGAFTGLDPDNGTVTIGGVKYSFIDGTLGGLTKNEVGNQYTVYLDVFGQIFKKDVDNTVAKYAILDDVTYSRANGVYSATLYTADGTLKTYTIDDDKIKLNGAEVTDMRNVITKVWPGTPAPYGKGYEGTGDVNGDKVAVQNRVVSYRVSTSTGKLTAIDVLPAAKDSVIEGEPDTYEVYNEKRSKIGDVKIGSATNIVDAEEYVTEDTTSSLKMFNIDALVDETGYAAYAYGDKLSDGNYPFVVITHSETSDYNDNTRFAVITGAQTSTVEDEETTNTVQTIAAFYEGEETELVFEEDVNTAALNRGDVIVIKKLDANGYIEEYEVIFESVVETATDTFINNVLTAAYAYTANPESATYGYNVNLLSAFDGWYTTKDEDDAIQVVFGPVVEKADASFSVATIAGTGTDIYTDVDADVAVVDNKANGGLIEVNYSSATNIYSYNTNTEVKAASRFENDAVIETSSVRYGYENAGTKVDENKIYWKKTADYDNNKAENIVFALALVIDGEAVDVLTFSYAN